MQGFMRMMSAMGDKAGLLGTFVSAMGCGACFPAIASIGAAAGLSFLSQWEGLFVNTLLPLFAGVALVANLLGWFSHRQYLRSILGMTGPAIVLAALFPLWDFDWSTDLMYAGMVMMLLVSLWDIYSSKNRRCVSGACETSKT
jgi:mercuric ion transport protein